MIPPQFALSSLSLAVKPWAGTAAGPGLRHPSRQLRSFQQRQSRIFKKKHSLSFGLGLWGSDHCFRNNNSRLKLLRICLITRKGSTQSTYCCWENRSGWVKKSWHLRIMEEQCLHHLPIALHKVSGNRFSNPRNLDLLIPFWDELVIVLSCVYLYTHTYIYIYFFLVCSKNFPTEFI